MQVPNIGADDYVIEARIGVSECIRPYLNVDRRAHARQTFPVLCSQHAPTMRLTRFLSLWCDLAVRKSALYLVHGPDNCNSFSRQVYLDYSANI
jgi:hypothetical protein